MNNKKMKFMCLLSMLAMTSCNLNFASDNSSTNQVSTNSTSSNTCPLGNVITDGISSNSGIISFLSLTTISFSFFIVEV